MIAKAGEIKPPCCRRSGKNKYPLNFVSFRTLYSAGQAGGVQSYLKKYLVMSKRNSGFGGKRKLERNEKFS